MIPRATPEFHVDDYGTVLEFEVRRGRNTVLDLSEICGCEVIFMRPDGSSFARPAQLVASNDSALPDGSDGILFYIIQPGDLDVAGNWHMQIFVAFSASSWSSSVIPFVVFPNLFELNAEQLSP